MCENGVMRHVRVLEIILGAVFIFSALTKALDVYTFAVQVSYYGVVREPKLVLAVAYTMVGVETLLGAALLAGIRLRGATLAATLALLAAFSGLIAYAWLFKDLEDCGCFGKYIPMGPGASLAKNAVLMALAAAAWVGHRRATRREANPETPLGKAGLPGYVLGGLGMVAILITISISGLPATSNPVSDEGNSVPASGKERPFAKFTVTDGGQTLDLGSGDYLVAMLSATCEHCEAATEVLNQIAPLPGVPPIVGLMMGDEKEMRDFRDLTAPVFPVQSIDTLEFFNLLDKQQAPPRFYITHDGAEVRYLDELDPTLDGLLAFATGTAAPAPAP